MYSYRIIFMPFIIYLCQWGLRHKKRGNRLLPVPRTEAFALPDTVEQTTLEPTPNMICPLYTTYFHTFIVWIYINRGMRIITSRVIYRCYVHDSIRKLRSFSSSRTKRQVNAFLICRDSRPIPASIIDVTIACFSSAWTSIESLLLGKLTGALHLPIRLD